MPTVFRVRGYRFFFYEAALEEPAHVHVAKSGCEAKIWIEPFGVAYGEGFKDHELNDIERIVQERYREIISAWQREQAKRNDH